MHHRAQTTIGPFFSDRKWGGRHQPNCPLAWTSQTQTNRLGLRLVSQFIRRGLEVALRLSFGAGGISIATDLAPFNIVQHHQSPTFQRACSIARKFATTVRSRLYDSRENLALIKEEIVPAVKVDLELFLSGLYDDFSAHRSSARDQLAHGVTLLHVSCLHRSRNRTLLSMFDRLAWISYAPCGHFKMSFGN
jgi:hypothetical protein